MPDENLLAALPRGDFDLSIKWLKWFAPDGDWTLTAIPPERGSGYTDTKAFTPATEEELRRWLSHHSGRNNIYFMVNPTMGYVKEKAKKEDVKELAWLHVDVDPPKCDPADLPNHQAAILKRLQEFKPAPSGLLMSGGGYQAFWRLEKPVFTGGNLESAAEQEAYNIQLAILLGGDNCHNIDRIMRLPGTINLPDAKKRMKGRTEVMAEAVSMTDVAYPLSDFMPAPRVQATDTGSVSEQAAVQISSKLPKITDLDQLGPNVLDRTRVLILTGADPTDPTRIGRSETVLAVACDLFRAGVADSVIASILLDKDFEISAHVLDQPRPRAYAVRQIIRAKEMVDENFECEGEGDSKKIKQTSANFRRAIRKLGCRLWFDAFARREMVEGLDGRGPELDDDVIRHLRLLIERHFHFRPAREHFTEVVQEEARDNPRHPILERLARVPWDGNPRLNRVLIDYAGAPDTPFVQAVSSIALIAAVHRLKEPGCKFDEMLVLESDEGKDKSTAIRILALEDDWFSDEFPLDADSKEIIENSQGIWIIEAADLHGLKPSGVDKLKAVLARREDRARLAYGRLASRVKRAFVVIGTTNRSEYLHSTTGNRRFWPVRIDKFDLERFRRDRDQLWAEAVAREAAGESIRLSPDLYPEAAAEQEKREIHDGLYYVLAEEFAGQTDCRVKIADIWTRLDIPAQQLDQKLMERVGSVMRKLGFERKKARFGGKQSEWGYVQGKGSRRLLADVEGRYRSGPSFGGKGPSSRAPF